MFAKTEKIIIIFSLILFAIDVIHTLIDPTIAMCIDGEVDTSFMTEDGSTYIFMNSWFWKLKPDLSGVEGKAGNISEHWNNLPHPMETSFYVSGNNYLNGSTFFVKNNKWYQFINKDFKEMGDTKNWSNFLSNEVMAISQYDDPVIVFYEKHRRNLNMICYFFDNPYFPDFKNCEPYDIPFNTFEAEGVISYKDGKYLIFYDDQRVGGHCIMKSSKSGCAVNRRNRDLFVCPEFTKNLFNQNIVIRFWFWTGLGLKQFGIISIGFLTCLSFILLHFGFILILKIRRKYKIKCKTNDPKKSQS